MTIIVGILMIVVGATLVVQSEWFLNNFGRIAWFEDKLGTEGGSRLGYKLIGILFIVLGIITMTGGGPAFLGWLLSPLLKYNLKQ
jgi:hypothetical protein